jgi:hypothetical protein
VLNKPGHGVNLRTRSFVDRPVRQSQLLDKCWPAKHGRSTYELFDRDDRDGGRFRARADRRLMAGAFKIARKALFTASDVGKASANSG